MPAAWSRRCVWRILGIKLGLSALFVVLWSFADARAQGAFATDAGATPAEMPVLTNVAQILALDPELATKNPPVRILGMVTHYEPDTAFFVQDETGGIFVYRTGPKLDLKAGDAVQVDGVANQGRYSPIIDSPRIRKLEATMAVNPKPVSLAEIYLGGLDSQWVELQAVVRSVKAFGDHLKLEIAVPPHRIPVWVSGFAGNAPFPVVGSLIRIRGVVGTLRDSKGQLSDFQILVGAPADIAVVKKASEDPFTGPLCSIRDLRRQHLRRNGVGRIRIRGIVTAGVPGNPLFIQDSDGGLEVRTTEPMEELAPGTVVEVAGFPGGILDAPTLEDALVRQIGAERTPKPVRLAADDLAHGRHALQLAELEAVMLERVDAPSNSIILSCQSNGRLLNAVLPLSDAHEKSSIPPPGSRLRLTGVCRFQETLPQGSSVISLWLRSPADLQVLATPVIASRLGSQLSIVVAIFSGAGLILALWHIGRQSRRTEHMLELQAALRTEMRQGEQQLRRSMEERERIGRDLHDDIIQSIYAVGLNLEDCRRVVRQAPDKAEERVASAINTLNTTIRSVRGFLAGLEPKVLNGREFKTALKSLALTSGEGQTQFQIEVDPLAANGLSSVQATQLLHIAKEAMSNCLRHAKAPVVNVSLQGVHAGVRLGIQDEGAGFDPATIDGRGHGLRNMNARARDLGAELEIVSAPGRGCRIVVTVPQRNSNGHG